MTLREQWQRLDASKVAQSIAFSFLVGYGTAVLPLLALSAQDFGAFMEQVLHRLWWLRFLSSGMTGAISFSLGQYFRSPFDTRATSQPPVYVSALPRRPSL